MYGNRPYDNIISLNFAEIINLTCTPPPVNGRIYKIFQLNFAVFRSLLREEKSTSVSLSLSLYTSALLTRFSQSMLPTQTWTYIIANMCFILNLIRALSIIGS